jgi:hypothetical protein
LEKIGFSQSDVDQCIFYRGNIIVICYVDDCLIFTKQESEATALISELKKTFILTDEGAFGEGEDVSSYLPLYAEYFTPHY